MVYQTSGCLHELSHNGTVLAIVTSDNEVRLWDAEARRFIDEFKFDATKLAGDVNSVAFSPDGKVLSAGDYFSNICAWGVPSGRILTDGKLPNTVYSMVWSEDSKAIALGDGGGLVRLLDVNSGKLVEWP